MTRIYQLNAIDQDAIDSTLLAAIEDNAGVETTKVTLAQLIQYLFNGASLDETSPFNDFDGQIAIGNNNVVNEDNSVAVGINNTASGYASVAVGAGNAAAAYGAIACGYQNTAGGEYSIAIGYSNNAGTSDSTIVIGKNNTLSAYEQPAQDAIAIGHNNVVFGIDEGPPCQSIGMGYNNFVAGSFNVAIGSGNQIETEGPVFSSVAIGYSNSSHANNVLSIGTTNTANGESSTAVGYNNQATGNSSIAVGYDNTASNDYSSVFGSNNSASGYGSTVCGSGCQAIGDLTAAFGYGAIARPIGTVNIGGGITIRADDGESSDGPAVFRNYSGVQNIIMSKNYDFTTTFDVEIDIPTGSAFYVDEVGIILDTSVSNVTVQPVVRFGWIGTLAGFVANVQTNNLIQVGSREIYNGLLTYDGRATLTASVTTAATADHLFGRFYFKGILVENTPIGD